MVSALRPSSPACGGPRCLHINLGYLPSNAYSCFKTLGTHQTVPQANPLEAFATLVAALGHDVGHEGLTNDFYIKSRHELAVRYNDVRKQRAESSCATVFRILRLAPETFVRN